MQPIPTAGLGLKPEHFDAALAARAVGIFFEVHAENYMVDGGPRLAWLARIAQVHPLSLHGVGLSLGSPEPPDRAHLVRFAALVERFEPALISEHLAWNRWQGVHFPDLFPVPRSAESLRALTANIGQVQDALGRCIAIENPTHYLALDHAWDEADFLIELARRSGCGLLLDVNNAFVGAANLGLDATNLVDAIPAHLIHEVHLAGHSVDPNYGAQLLIDSHDAPVADPVWALYRRLIARIGPKPTLIERDGNLPDFSTLMAERAMAAGLLGGLAQAA